MPVFPDPATTATFSQAIAAAPLLRNYQFGTRSGSNIQNLTQIAASFVPYGIAGTTPINGQWALIDPFTCMNYVFGEDSLNLTAIIPSTGGLKLGGITTGQIATIETFQPGLPGRPSMYAFDVRLQFPASPGMWPAVWLYTKQPGINDSSEIDIVEFMMGTNQGQHDWTGFTHGPQVGQDTYALDLNQWQIWSPGLDFSADTFGYQCIWTADMVYKYFCGTLIRATPFKWTSKGPAQLLVSHQVGGQMPGLQPTSATQFPALLSLKSIRIYAV